ncbi:hypothetical protein ABT144_29670 [Streptomyces sp. NPDC002039]|uniref:hypothetical protein n=1 Tax=Streptomyces sp. NPDC002039 TaxID=3154660 RepID=UPI0033206341
MNGAAGELTPGYAQLPQFQALDERLARMAQAVADRHTSQQMDAHVLEVEPAVNGWGMGLSDDVDDAERRLMAYPLAHLLLDTQRLQDRVRATVVVVQAAHAAQRAATPATPVQVDPASRTVSRLRRSSL